MAANSSDWTGKWLSQKLEEHANVKSVDLIRPQVLKIVRKKYGTAFIGSVALKRVTCSKIESLFDEPFTLSFIVNIPSESFWTGRAIELAESRSLGFGGMDDLYRALNEPCVDSYKRKEFSYFEQVVNQHSNVHEVARVHDRKYVLRRYEHGDVKVVLLNEYALCADDVRTARDRFGAFRAILITNPNGDATSKAKQAARSIGARIFKMRAFLGFLGDGS